MSCWFCNITEEDPEKAYRLSLFGEVDAKARNSVTKVHYLVHQIGVPRCAQCRSKHRAAAFVFVVSVLLLVTALILAVRASFDVSAGFLRGLIAGLLGGAGLTGAAVYAALHKGIASTAKARKDYPGIVALREKGYRFGKAPKNSNIEVHSEEGTETDTEPARKE